MKINEFFSHPIVIGILVAVPSFTLGYLGYRRSQKADKAATQAGAVEQVIDGLNKLVDNLQDDNKILRADVIDLRTKLQAVLEERDKLKEQLYVLQRAYGTTNK